MSENKSTPATTGEVLHRIRLMVEEAEEEDGPVHLPSKGMTLLGAVCEEVEAALAALPPCSGWEPIETAPRDDLKVDLWVVEEGYGEHRLADCWWDGRWMNFDNHGEVDEIDRDFRPTHWRPVPPPPSKA